MKRVFIVLGLILSLLFMGIVFSQNDDLNDEWEKLAEAKNEHVRKVGKLGDIKISGFDHKDLKLISKTALSDGRIMIDISGIPEGVSEFRYHGKIEGASSAVSYIFEDGGELLLESGQINKDLVYLPDMINGKKADLMELKTIKFKLNPGKILVNANGNMDVSDGAKVSYGEAIIEQNDKDEPIKRLSIINDDLIRGDNLEVTHERIGIKTTGDEEKYVSLGELIDYGDIQFASVSRSDTGREIVVNGRDMEIKIAEEKYLVNNDEISIPRVSRAESIDDENARIINLQNEGQEIIYTREKNDQSVSIAGTKVIGGSLERVCIAKFCTHYYEGFKSDELRYSYNPIYEGKPSSDFEISKRFIYTNRDNYDKIIKYAVDNELTDDEIVGVFDNTFSEFQKTDIGKLVSYLEVTTVPSIEQKWSAVSENLKKDFSNYLPTKDLEKFDKFSVEATNIFVNGKVKPGTRFSNVRFQLGNKVDSLDFFEIETENGVVEHQLPSGHIGNKKIIDVDKVRFAFDGLIRDINVKRQEGDRD
ncbi:hypothetical protein CMI42_05085 [Candidatus Pacearchaeota archaeon]|nr:hypothetical protein [Candidatus Pacearchaeota archaeon]